MSTVRKGPGSNSTTVSKVRLLARHRLHPRNLAFLELLAAIDRHFDSSYAIFGSSALSCYFGYPIDSHRDVDLIVKLPPREVVRIVKAAGWSEVALDQSAPCLSGRIKPSPTSHSITCMSAGAGRRLHIDIRILSENCAFPTFLENKLRFFPIRDWSKRRHLRIRWYEPAYFAGTGVRVLSPESALATYFLSPVTPKAIVATALLRPMMLAAEKNSRLLYKNVPLFRQFSAPNWQYAMAQTGAFRFAS